MLLVSLNLCRAVTWSLFLAVAAGVSAQPMRVVGSDLMGPAFLRVVEKFVAEESDVTFALDGTRLAGEALRAGRGDLGLMIQPTGAAEWSGEWVQFPLAYHVFVLVASADLPLNQLNFAQVGDIFGVGGATQMRWGDFGALGEWRGRTILPKIVGPQAGLASDLLRYTVLRTPNLKPTVEVLPTTAEVLRQVQGNLGAIGIVPSMPAGTSGLKLLVLAPDEREVAFGPTPQNVHAGDYPARLPVSLVMRRTDAQQLSRLVRFLLSEEVAEALAVDGLVALPRTVRNELIFRLETLAAEARR